MKVENNTIETKMEKTISIKFYKEILSLFDQPCFFSFELEMHIWSPQSSNRLALLFRFSLKIFLEVVSPLLCLVGPPLYKNTLTAVIG